MFKRWTSLALVLMCMAALMPVSAGEAALPVMAGYEEEGSYRDWKSNLFFQRMQQFSGLSFQYLQYSGMKAWQEAKAAMLLPQAALPDVLMKANLSPAETIAMLDSGVLIDLLPLVKDYAPNLYRLLQDNPDCLQMITLPGGRIGALPYISLSATQNCLWINAAWLTALKLPVPASADELEAALSAFKTKDPNRNGSGDEIPLAFLGAYDLKYLAHAFGLVANDYNVSSRGGQAVFMPSEPAFRDFVAWCRGLFQSGLLDKDGFATADSLRQVTDAKSTVKYGAMFAPLPTNLVPAEWSADYAVVPPLAYEGKQAYRNVAPRAVPGCFAITSACENPAQMLRWVDYLYSPEGAIMAFAGLEGQDYLIDGDGTWRKTPSAEQNSFLDEVTIASGSTPPGINNDDFQRLYHDAAVRRISQEIDKTAAFASDPFPPYSLTYEQEKRVAPLQNAIGRYVDESLARWVIGEWDLTDEQFAVFSQELEHLGLKEFLAFWQEVLTVTEEAKIELH